MKVFSCNACVAPCYAGIRPRTAPSSSPRTAHARLTSSPVPDGENPGQITTPASGLDGDDCGQQVAPAHTTPASYPGPHACFFHGMRSRPGNLMRRDEIDCAKDLA